MFKYVVYAEQSLEGKEILEITLKKLGNPKVLFINNYQQLLNQPGEEWRLQKQTQKIILAERQDNFYYKGSEVTPDFGFKHFYYNTLALNCLYDCQYCYLQGVFNAAHLVVFLNNKQFIAETEKLIRSVKEPVYLALSYDTDLPALEWLYPFCTEWINFAKQNKQLTLEIRTKSAVVNHLQNLEPIDNVILAWTLSPQKIIDMHEPLTPKLSLRVNAIKKAIEQGWKVRVCIDPILYIPNWEDVYDEFINEIAKEINFKEIDSFSLGVYRMNKNYHKKLQQQRKDTGLLYAPMINQNDVISYEIPTKNKLTYWVQQKIKHIYNHPHITIV